MPTFEHDGLTFAYETWGDPEAPAVVLLHGFTSDLRMWHPVVERIAGDYAVIAMDLRGHGQSAAPEDLSLYTAELLAGDVGALLDHLGVDLCVLVGCSFGGMIALQYAVDAPGRLAGLVLTDTSAAYDHPDYDERYRERERRIEATTEVVARFGTMELGRRAAATISDPFLARGLRERYARISAAGWVGCAKVRRERPNLLPVIGARLTMPVMVCFGEDDPVRSAAEVMCRELPRARQVMFRATGHGVPVLQPERFSRELIRFFRDLEDGREVAGRSTVG
ncbi:alpha/beta fold hydrolase [Tepidiforma sp.]|uniref:alpha/beta fold hydrolase n=1 Tax=Tepidiforma sp. TaxID=2682230 RepID=UPI002ADD61D2|nr:alpha/beta fold hydrolase [Tepidiforma sp.]